MGGEKPPEREKEFDDRDKANEQELKGKDNFIDF